MIFEICVADAANGQGTSLDAKFAVARSFRGVLISVALLRTGMRGAMDPAKGSSGEE